MARYLRLFFGWPGWRDLVARLPLPMLALAASYGVFRFASMFVPTWVAIVQAAAFELVYIGLAVVRLSDGQRRRAIAISVGAVVVSMIYNTLDGLFHLRPSLLVDSPLWLHIVLSILHGVPLALLAYLVSDLLLHQPQSSAKSFGALEEKTTSSGRPLTFTLDGLVSSVRGVERFTRDEAIQLMGCSASVIDRLLSEGIQTKLFERVDRGVYRPL